MQIKQEKGHYTLYKESEAIGTAVVDGAAILRLEIVPAWRARLRQLSGKGAAAARRRAGPEAGHTLHCAPAPGRGRPCFGAAVRLLLRRAGGWCAAVPDLSAVGCAMSFWSCIDPGGLYLDATCGNGNDTLFLCRLAGQNGRVLAMDIQQKAVDRTNRRLTDAGYEKVGRAVLYDHAKLGKLVQPGKVDCVLFNFGWLPGAEHTVHSTAQGQSFRPCVPRWMPQPRRCAGGCAVQRQGHRRCRKAGGAGVFPAACR